MSAELLLRDLGAWSVQVGALALVVAVAGRLLPVEPPRSRLLTTQAALWLSLLLPLLQPWRSAGASVQALLGGATMSRTAEGPLPGARPILDWGVLWPALALALLAGTLVQLARLVAGVARLRALGREAEVLEPPPWLAALRDELAPRTSFRTCEAAAPATFGLRRPVVLLPRAFAALQREQQRGIVLHELLHVRRRHWLAQLVEEALAAVLFFHPAVRWLIARVRLAREQCVDADVVSRLGRRDAYLESLVVVARAAFDLRAVPAAPFLRESHLRERVELLLKEKIMSRSRTLLNIALTALAVLVAVGWTASALPLEKPAAPAAVAPGSEPKILHKVNPVYPESAKKEGVQGIFHIEIVLGADGAAKDARVIASAPNQERLGEVKKGTPGATEGDSRLAEAALAAVRQWRFEPVLRNGKPVEALMTVTINFKLDDKKPR